MTTTTTINTLPNNLATLRTGTAADGRALFRVRSADALRDLRSRLPSGWTLELHQNGVDAVLTSDEVVARDAQAQQEGGAR